MQVNIAIMRAFVHLRELMLTHKDLTSRIDDLEQRYDRRFRTVFDAIRELVAAQQAQPKRRMGFLAAGAGSSN